MPQTKSMSLEGEEGALESQDISKLPDLDTLKAQKEKLGATLDALVAECTVTAASDDKDDAFFVQELMTGEQLERHERISANYEAVCQALRRREAEDEADKSLADRAEFIDTAADRTKNKQLEVDVAFHKTLMDIGQGKFESPVVLEQGGRNELALDVPVITKDNSGRNKIIPIEAVFGNSDEAIEQSYKVMEIIHAGMQDKYSADGRLLENIDASTISAAVSSNPIHTTDVTMPTLVMRMYAYLIDMQELFKYCTIIQEPTLAPLKRDRRTAIPEVTVIGEGGKYTVQNPDYTPLEIPVNKYGRILQFGLESTMSGAGFDIASDIVKVAGMALSNGYGKVSINGQAAANAAAGPPRVGKVVKSTGVLEGSSEGATLASSTAFSGNSPTFTYKHLLGYLTSLSDAYWKSISKRIVYNLNFEQHIKSMLDDNKRPYFEYNTQELFPGIKIMIDPGMPSFDTKKASSPILYGDLAGHIVRMAGSPRISFSDEYGFDTDNLSYKITGFMGCATQDPNAIKHHKFTV